MTEYKAVRFALDIHYSPLLCLITQKVHDQEKAVLTDLHTTFYARHSTIPLKRKVPGYKARNYEIKSI